MPAPPPPAIASGLPLAPADLAGTVEAILASPGGSPAALAERVERMAALVEATAEVCRRRP
jgi:hypothetical protein